MGHSENMRGRGDIRDDGDGGDNNDIRDGRHGSRLKHERQRRYQR